MSDFNPKADIYNTAGRRVQAQAFQLSAFALGITILAVTASIFVFRANGQTIILSFAAAWAVGAPIWFFYEYFAVYRRHAAEGSWELFKHGQQVAVAVWAGLTATLYALGTSELVKPKPATYECKVEGPKQPASSISELKLVCGASK